ncbi:hypothetical protein KF913_10715 [Candidatus Obscuribacterales bacterium]|nr:hypothetical protein [Candidatus Obscuribacterales bacterium]
MIELEHDAERRPGSATGDSSTNNAQTESSEDYFAADCASAQNDKPDVSLRSIFFDKHIDGKPQTDSPQVSALGVLIVMGGILVPALTISTTLTANAYSVCGVLWRHWFETLIQFGLLVSVPAGIAFAWSKIKNNDMRRVRLIGYVIGLSLGSALLTAVIMTASVVMKFPTMDHQGIDHIPEMSYLACVSWLAVLAASCVALQFRRHWPTKGAKRSSSVYVLIGAALSLLALVGSEARSACIRIAEKLVVAGTSEQQQNGLNFLRQIDCERDIKLDCSTARAFDLSGMFLRLDNEQNKKLYFLSTGQPYRFDLLDKAEFSALPDEMLGRNVIGDKVANLSMHRSLISGMLHPESLTSTIDWTFVFKNDGAEAREARAEIGLPKDAVISEMVLWINGVPKRATIASAERAKDAYQWVVGGRRDPALVTDLGKGRVLVQCYPVAPHAEVRIKISMKSSMKLDKAGEAVASLPTLLKSNFEVEGDHRVHLRSDRKLMLDLDNVRHVVANNGLHQVSGTLASAKRSRDSIDVRVHRDAKITPVAIKDPLDSRGYIVQQYVPTTSNKPDHLVVVVDGSSAIAAHKDEIVRQLSKIPHTIPTSLIVASEQYKDGMQFHEIDDAIKAMKQVNFKGGQENLGAVIKGAELAGETEGGAVLWIHGPQPALDKELYIIAPYLVKPKFYELSIEDSVTDVNEFFKNHQEIGPFTAVARNSSFEKDLGRFLRKWQADGVDYTLRYARTFDKPAALESSIYVQDEISRLYVAQRVRELVNKGNRWDAANLAVSYQVVTPVTSAVVLENSSDYARFGLHEAAATDGSDSILAKTAPKDGFRSSRINTVSSDSSDRTVATAGGAQSLYGGDMMKGSNASAPSLVGATMGGQLVSAYAGDGTTLQGATNGTIATQGADATTIMGLNTAGTVRVNNLANLEALLNILANCLQVSGIGFGLVMLTLAFIKTDSMMPSLAVRLSRSSRVILGLSLLALGLATPGFLNYMVSSARDANLFS